MSVHTPVSYPFVEVQVREPTFFETERFSFGYVSNMPIKADGLVIRACNRKDGGRQILISHHDGLGDEETIQLTGDLSLSPSSIVSGMNSIADLQVN